MSHYVKDLSKVPCWCATNADTDWFVTHPDRSKYIRVPYDCEVTDLGEDQAEIVSQIVAVWIDKSLNEMTAHTDGPVKVQTYRRSFLFIGNADWHRISDDAGVDRFMEFISDGSGALVSMSLN